MRKQITRAAGNVDSPVAVFCQDFSKLGQEPRTYEAPVSGLVLAYPGRSRTARKKVKTADLLSVLEAENAWLRDRAADLALQIQDLSERARSGTS